MSINWLSRDWNVKRPESQKSGFQDSRKSRRSKDQNVKRPESENFDFKRLEFQKTRMSRIWISRDWNDLRRKKETFKYKRLMNVPVVPVLAVLRHRGGRGGPPGGAQLLSTLGRQTVGVPRRVRIRAPLGAADAHAAVFLVIGGVCWSHYKQ